MTTLAPPAPPAPARHAAAPAPSFLRHTGALAWRGIVKTIHSTEALLGLSLQPIMFLVIFTYVFGGAISGSTPRVPAICAAGPARAERCLFATLRARFWMLNPGIQCRGVRPLPQPADRALGPAGRRDQGDMIRLCEYRSR